jgi:hypothetical protein
MQTGAGSKLQQPESASLCGQSMAGSGDRQLPVLYAFSADQLIGNSFDQWRLAPNDEHFEAIVVIQVDVQRRDDRFVMVVLEVGQGLLQSVFVMVIDQRDCAGDLVMAKLLLVFDKLVADHVGNG